MVNGLASSPEVEGECGIQGKDLLSNKGNSVVLLPPPGIASNLDPFRLNSPCQLSEVGGDGALRKWCRDGHSGNTLSFGVD